MIGLLILAGELIRGAQAPRLLVSSSSSKRTSLSGNRRFRAAEEFCEGEAPSFTDDGPALPGIRPERAVTGNENH